MINLFDYFDPDELEDEIFLEDDDVEVPEVSESKDETALAEDREIWEKLVLADEERRARDREDFFEIFWESAKMDVEFDEYYELEGEINDYVSGRAEILWDVRDKDDSFTETIFYKRSARQYRINQREKHSGKLGRYLWDKHGLSRKPSDTSSRVRNTFFAGKGCAYKKAGGRFYG